MVTSQGPVAPPPPLTEAIVGPVKNLITEMWPGVPVLPTLAPWGTDAVYLNAAGIPTYGIDAAFSDSKGNGVHGLNEYVPVEYLYKGRDFLYRLIKIYASGA